MPGSMTYRYPWRAMAPDYTRAIAGLGCTGVPAVFMDLPLGVTAVLGFLAAIFLLFGLQAALRHGTRLRVSDRSIHALPLGPSLPWDGLTRLTLAYFSVRRDRRNGWMELKMRGGGRTLRVDSRLEGFAEVVRQAAAAAAAACLHLDAATVGNLATLGITVPNPGGPRNQTGSDPT